MGKAIVSGAGRASLGILASSFEVGTVVKLMENGTATDFIVVNQGNPDESLYDSSCNGTWLLRKDVYDSDQWNTTSVNNYKASAIYNRLNDATTGILGRFDAKTQNIIKEVKIPYWDGTGSGGSAATGTNGLTSKLFLLSMLEAGFVGSFYPATGVKLDWFISGMSTTALNHRIAYENGEVSRWWMRDPSTDTSNVVYNVDEQGGSSGAAASGNYYGIRYALIIPSTSRFDPTTLLLKG